MNRSPLGVAAALALATCACSSTPRPVTAQERGVVAMGEAILGLPVTTRVLLIAAHPDDEDSRLLAWLARGRHVETAYLSLTRGDGGQNLIGNELGDALGVVRTEELLAARRIDGAHQYFGREYDFGFSKSAAETFTHWPHDSVLGDVVTVVRAFRPHVIVAVFTGTPADGHGHHQVSGIVAREAYDAAGDTVRFPVTTYGPAWTPAKFYRDRSYFGGGDSTLAIEVGGSDALRGETYSAIAALSRSQHKSQGFGQNPRLGPATAYLAREATRVDAATPRARERSLFDGIDTTWRRLAPALGVPAERALLDTIGTLASAIPAAWRAADPVASIPALATLDAALGRLTDTADADVARTRAIARGRVQRALRAAIGTEEAATVDHDVVAVRLDSIRVTETLRAAGDPRISATASPVAWSDGPLVGATSGATTVVVRDTAVSQPWWLERPRVGDLFGMPVSRIAEDERVAGELTLRGVVTAALAGPPGATPSRDPLTWTIEPRIPVVDRVADPVRGEIDRPLAGVPAVSILLDQTVAYVPAGRPIDRVVGVALRAGLGVEQHVTVSVETPRGLAAEPTSIDVTLPPYGARRVEFRLRGTMAAGAGTLAVVARAEGEAFRRGYVLIDYPHIRPQRLYRDAVTQIHAVDVRIPAGLTVAYIQGVGDNVAPALASLGIPVTVLDTASLARAELGRYSAVVVGPRAYAASPAVAAASRRLLDYARTGGTLVVQYGQTEMADGGYMPYPITLPRTSERVTDENAPVTVLDPRSPILTAPNRITDADWAGWVQERATYMPHAYDPRYVPVVSMHDPGEPANTAAILVAPLGRGTYVYTTLAFFRQLPAGNVGAARLFVNLLAAGHPTTAGASTGTAP